MQHSFLCKLLILPKLSESNCCSSEADNLSNTLTDGTAIIFSWTRRGCVFIVSWSRVRKDITCVWLIDHNQFTTLIGKFWVLYSWFDSQSKITQTCISNHLYTDKRFQYDSFLNKSLDFLLFNMTHALCSSTYASILSFLKWIRLYALHGYCNS